MRAFFLLVVLLCGVAQAQDYPSKSVRLIAAAAPGGNPDILARMLAAKLSDAFGRPFVVENIPGAGGVVAAEQVARAAADGHTLMLGDSGAMAINVALNPKLSYNPLKDFTLITALAAVPTVSRETSVGEVMKCFLRNGSNKALVVDREEHLQGIVTVMDLVAAGADGHSEKEKE